MKSEPSLWPSTMMTLIQNLIFNTGKLKWFYTNTHMYIYMCVCYTHMNLRTH
jgi:hypothetical protein